MTKVQGWFILSGILIIIILIMTQNGNEAKRLTNQAAGCMTMCLREYNEVVSASYQTCIDMCYVDVGLPIPKR